MILRRLICVFSIFFLFLTGCDKHTYPRQRVIASVKELCKNDYNLDVEVKISGGTIGTYLQIDNLFDRKSGLSKQASEHLGSILLSVSRVCLSTDADFDFYVVVAADTAIPGMEATFVRPCIRCKRFLLGNISREDFFNRLLINVRFNPQMLARRTVMNFFSSLSSGDIAKALSTYSKKRLKGFSMTFFKLLFELKMKKDMRYEIEKIKMKPLPKEQTLVYARVRENYSPDKGYEDKDFLFPSGTTTEYLFHIGAHNYSPEIWAIYPLFKKNEQGGIEQTSIPEAYDKYGDVSICPENDFLLEDISFPQFLADQMAQRIVRRVREKEATSEKQKEKMEKKIKWKKTLGLLSREKEEGLTQEAQEKEKTFHVETVKGVFTEEEQNGKDKLFQINFKFKSPLKVQPSFEELTSISMKIINEVLKHYHYADFNSVILSDAKSQKALGTYGKNAVMKTRW